MKIFGNYKWAREPLDITEKFEMDHDGDCTMLRIGLHILNG